MRLPSFFLIFLTFIFCSRCSVVPMPVTAVPDRSHSLEATLCAGTNGAGVHALYATKHMVILDATAQTTFIGASSSRSYEFGIGRVIKNQFKDVRTLVAISYGAGRYTRSPWIQSGGRGSITAVHGDVRRASMYVNRPFSSCSGGVARFSVYWGNSTQDRYLDPDLPAVYFNSYGLETIYYRLMGKNRNFISGIGLSYNTGRSDGTRLKEFITSPVFLFAGYRFTRKPAITTRN